MAKKKKSHSKSKGSERSVIKENIKARGSIDMSKVEEKLDKLIASIEASNSKTVEKKSRWEQINTPIGGLIIGLVITFFTGIFYLPSRVENLEKSVAEIKADAKDFRKEVDDRFNKTDKSINDLTLVIQKLDSKLDALNAKVDGLKRK